MHSFKCCSVTKLRLTFRDPWTVACQAALSSTMSWSLLQFIDLNVNLKKKMPSHNMSRGIWALWLAAVTRPPSLPSALVLAFPSGVTRPHRWQRFSCLKSSASSSSFLSQVPALAFVTAPGVSGVPLLPRVASPLVGICFIHGPRGAGVSAGSRFPGVSSVAVSEGSFEVVVFSVTTCLTYISCRWHFTHSPWILFKDFFFKVGAIFEVF